MKAIQTICGIFALLLAVVLHVLLSYLAYSWFGLFWGIVVFFIPILSDLIMLGICWSHYGFLNLPNLIFGIMAVLFLVGEATEKGSE